MQFVFSANPANVRGRSKQSSPTNGLTVCSVGWAGGVNFGFVTYTSISNSRAGLGSKTCTVLSSLRRYYSVQWNRNCSCFIKPAGRPYLHAIPYAQKRRLEATLMLIMQIPSRRRQHLPRRHKLCLDRPSVEVHRYPAARSPQLRLRHYQDQKVNTSLPPGHSKLLG